MHFRIFVPSDTPQPEASSKPLENVGLGYLALGFMAKFDRVDGKPGMIYHWPQPADHLIDGDGLKWESAIAYDGLDEGRYLIGMNPDKLPRPAELQAKMRVPGYHLQLGRTTDHWLIPEVVRLPTKMLMGSAGLREERINRYNELTISADWVRQSETLLDQINSGRANDPIAWEVAWRFCLQSLQINYRVTPEVANALELVTSDKASKIILSAIGLMSSYDKQQEDAGGG
jgi:hypothetical protein